MKTALQQPPKRSLFEKGTLLELKTDAEFVVLCTGELHCSNFAGVKLHPDPTGKIEDWDKSQFVLFTGSITLEN